MITEATTLTGWEKLLLITIPSILISVSAIGLFIFQRIYYPDFEYSTLDAFIYLALSNFMVWMTLKDRYDTRPDYSGYLLFYALIIGLGYFLVSQASFGAWNILVLGLIMTYRLAYRLRFGGFPIISFIVNTISIYLLLHHQSITWLLNLYFVAQVLELFVEKRVQTKIRSFTDAYSGWILIAYAVVVTLIMISTATKKFW